MNTVTGHGRLATTYKEIEDFSSPPDAAIFSAHLKVSDMDIGIGIYNEPLQYVLTIAMYIYYVIYVFITLMKLFFTMQTGHGFRC